MQLSFFCKRSTSVVAAKDVAITCNLTRLQPHQAKTTLAAILQCHGMEFFFELVLFLPMFFATVFFAKSLL
jgi:hypothetical protein